MKKKKQSLFALHMDNCEKQLIQTYYRHCLKNVELIASHLGISRASAFRLVKKHCGDL